MIIKYLLPKSPPVVYESKEDSVIFGRASATENHVDVDLEKDEYVSHRHARLYLDGKDYWIEDLGSANGTWVNGEILKKRKKLSSEDVIQVGWTIIFLQKKEEPPKYGIRGIARENIIEHGTAMKQKQPGFGKIEQASEATIINPGTTNIPASYYASPEISDELDIYSKNADKSFKPVEDECSGISGSIPEGDIFKEDEITGRSLLFSKSTKNESLIKIWQQLKACNDLSNMLSEAGSFENIIDILVNDLRKSIPNALRGAILLPDKKGELLLKAHWPAGNHSVSMTLVKRAFDSCEPFLWTIPKEKSIEDETPDSVICFHVQSAIYVPLLFGREAIGVIYVDNLYTRNAFSSTDFEIMRAIGNQVAVLINDRFLPRERHKEELFKLNLSRQFSPEMAEYMSGDIGRRRIGGERIDPATILMSDVRSFTQISASMEPDDVVRMLNEMFDAFVPIIFEHNGIIDKFIGDSVLAVFGSPKPDDRQWKNALLAAFEMQKAVHKICEGRAVRRLPVFNVGISIHTGKVIHGLIGSAKRMEFTVIGDTVNQSSRYCDGAGPDEIVISKSVYEHVYRMTDVVSKIIKTKHPDKEPDLEAYVVTALK
ncbi:MAG: hypothetical protein QG578_801 [Thermodesulfobacteriota bacterium]|nr:hypothetical protein [Thermodesulfobacteriota bacterium]